MNTANENCTPVEINDADRVNEILALRIKRRDEQALSELFRVNKALLRTVISRVVHHEVDVDDVLAVMMVELWDLIDNYDESKGKFLGWLVTLARRRSIDYVRRKLAYQRALDGVEAQDRHIGDSREPHEWEGDYSKDRHRRLLELLHGVHVPDAQRECLILHWFEGLSQRDIAARLDIPLGTVKTRLELGFRVIGSLVVHDKVFKAPS